VQEPIETKDVRKLTALLNHPLVLPQVGLILAAVVLTVMAQNPNRADPGIGSSTDDYFVFPAVFFVLIGLIAGRLALGMRRMGHSNGALILLVLSGLAMTAIAILGALSPDLCGLGDPPDLECPTFGPQEAFAECVAIEIGLITQWAIARLHQ
jgi:hypothetical protein